MTINRITMRDIVAMELLVDRALEWIDLDRDDDDSEDEDAHEERDLIREFHRVDRTLKKLNTMAALPITPEPITEEYISNIGQGSEFGNDASGIKDELEINGQIFTLGNSYDNSKDYWYIEIDYVVVKYLTDKTKAIKAYQKIIRQHLPQLTAAKPQTKHRNNSR